MISYLIQKNWKYLSPIVVRIPDKLLRVIAKGFIRLQKHEIMGEKTPKRIVFFVTKKCNLHCKHCFYIPHTHPSPEMSLGQIKLIADSMKSNLKQVTFTGGEPFVRNDFPEIVLSFAKNGVQVMNINTNGTLTERVRLFLEKILKETRVSLVFMMSLDGPPAIHDSIRGISGASETTFQTVALLSEYQKKYPSRLGNIVVSTSINRLNIAYLPEIISRVKQFKNIVHIFNFTRSANLHTFGVPPNDLSGFDVGENIVLDVTEMKQVLKYLDREFWTGKNISLPTLASRRIMIEAVRLLEKKVAHFACLAGRTEVIVYPEGDVGICEMLKPIGNIKETNYDLDKFYRKERDKFQAVKKCSCIHDCNLTSSIRFSPESLVEAVKKKPKLA